MTGVALRASQALPRVARNLPVRFARLTPSSPCAQHCLRDYRNGRELGAIFLKMVRLDARGYLNLLVVHCGIERMGFLSVILSSPVLADLMQGY